MGTLSITDNGGIVSIFFRAESMTRSGTIHSIKHSQICSEKFLERSPCVSFLKDVPETKLKPTKREMERPQIGDEHWFHFNIRNNHKMTVRGQNRWDKS